MLINKKIFVTKLYQKHIEKHKSKKY